MISRGFMLLSSLAVMAVFVSHGRAQNISSQAPILNLEIVFLGAQTPPHTILYKVRPHDTLMKLAKKFYTTVELIKKRNHLDSDFIRDGQKLSIWTGRFDIVVDKSDNTLTLLLTSTQLIESHHSESGGRPACRQGRDTDYHSVSLLLRKSVNEERVIKVYPVSTGKESTSTPIGEFTIKDRLVDPVWFHHGIVIPPGVPENFLGTRWLGFNIPKYGIHGTVEPELIGKSVSGGCVRMRNEDVEELYMLIPEGTKVFIKE